MELVADRSQGVQLEALQALARYWLDEYDFGRVESRLNPLPQFVTEIDGVDIHFIHVRSAHDDALPLIMTHGWPGSVIEMIDTVGPLTDPAAHGGSDGDAFHLVLPSLPGYGFSAEPVEIGWDLGRTARAWTELMQRLGYTRFVAQGGDVGAGVTDAMSRQEPDGLMGIHTNLLVPALNGPMPTNTDEEKAAAAQLAIFRQSGNGYFVEMATRPQTIGYALLDSPIALGAWMIDHDTDAYYKIPTPPPQAPSRCPRRRSRSPSRRSQARSGRRRAAGSRRATRTSSTSTRSTRADTSPRGRSPSSSEPSSGPHSSHCGRRHEWAVRIVRAAHNVTTRRPAARQTRSRCRRDRRPSRGGRRPRRWPPARKSGSLCHSQLSGQLRLRESRPKLAERCRFDLPRAFGRQTEAGADLAQALR
jgi:hypothetical protein